MAHIAGHCYCARFAIPEKAASDRHDCQHQLAVHELASWGGARVSRGREFSTFGLDIAKGRWLIRIVDERLRKTPDPFCFAIFADDSRQRIASTTAAVALTLLTRFRRRADA
jgi:hypothetical protein